MAGLCDFLPTTRQPSHIPIPIPIHNLHTYKQAQIHSQQQCMLGQWHTAHSICTLCTIILARHMLCTWQSRITGKVKDINGDGDPQQMYWHTIQYKNLITHALSNTTLKVLTIPWSDNVMAKDNTLFTHNSSHQQNTAVNPNDRPGINKRERTEKTEMNGESENTIKMHTCINDTHKMFQSEV